MSAEMLDFIIIPVSLGVSGIIFFIIAICLNCRYSYKGGIKSTGILKCFRKYDENYGLDSRLYSKRYMKHKLCGIYNPHKVKYTDYMYNYPNSKPVISFKVNGIPIECCSEWSVTDLDKEDIGKEIPIQYFYDKNGEIARIILEGKQYEKHRERGRKIMFWVFASIGIILIILAVLSVFVCY